MLFFGYGLLSDVDVLTIVLAGLGATCVASAVFLILELSDPYSGLFRMPREGFDGIVRNRRRAQRRRPTQRLRFEVGHPRIANGS